MAAAAQTQGEYQFKLGKFFSKPCQVEDGQAYSSTLQDSAEFFGSRERTLQFLACCAKAVYAPSGAEKLIVHKFKPVPHHVQIEDDFSSTNHNLFQAAAYVNDDYPHVAIVAFRGTASKRTGYQDVCIGRRSQKGAAFDLMKLCDQAAMYAAKIAKEPALKKVYVTGHSLGGFIAESVASITNLEGAAFNSPGPWENGPALFADKYFKAGMYTGIAVAAAGAKITADVVIRKDVLTKNKKGHEVLGSTNLTAHFRPNFEVHINKEDDDPFGVAALFPRPHQSRHICPVYWQEGDWKEEKRRRGLEETAQPPEHSATADEILEELKSRMEVGDKSGSSLEDAPWEDLFKELKLRYDMKAEAKQRAEEEEDEAKFNERNAASHEEIQVEDESQGSVEGEQSQVPDDDTSGAAETPNTETPKKKGFKAALSSKLTAGVHKLEHKVHDKVHALEHKVQDKLAKDGVEKSFKDALKTGIKGLKMANKVYNPVGAILAEACHVAQVRGKKAMDMQKEKSLYCHGTCGDYYPRSTEDKRLPELKGEPRPPFRILHCDSTDDSILATLVAVSSHDTMEDAKRMYDTKVCTDQTTGHAAFAIIDADGNFREHKGFVQVSQVVALQPPFYVLRLNKGPFHHFAVDSVHDRIGDAKEAYKEVLQTKGVETCGIADACANLLHSNKNFSSEKCKKAIDKFTS